MTRRPHNQTTVSSSLSCVSGEVYILVKWQIGLHLKLLWERWYTKRLTTRGICHNILMTRQTRKMHDYNFYSCMYTEKIGMKSDDEMKSFEDWIIMTNPAIPEMYFYSTRTSWTQCYPLVPPKSGKMIQQMQCLHVQLHRHTNRTESAAFVLLCPSPAGSKLRIYC